jgi:hypothetical protein
MSTSDPNTRTASQNVREILIKRYGFKRGDFRVRSQSDNRTFVFTNALPAYRAMSPLRSSNLMVEDCGSYLVVEA